MLPETRESQKVEEERRACALIGAGNLLQENWLFGEVSASESEHRTEKEHSLFVKRRLARGVRDMESMSLWLTLGIGFKLIRRF